SSEILIVQGDIDGRKQGSNQHYAQQAPEYQLIYRQLDPVVIFKNQLKKMGKRDACKYINTGIKDHGLQLLQAVGLEEEYEVRQIGECIKHPPNDLKGPVKLSLIHNYRLKITGLSAFFATKCDYRTLKVTSGKIRLPAPGTP
ncbi:MAG: hypothetical protein K8I82_23075, partial [Anaerolineae bacterium]|nr:hypothetical protein [Anaerolineae bacterium]